MCRCVVMVLVCNEGWCDAHSAYSHVPCLQAMDVAGKTSIATLCM